MLAQKVMAGASGVSILSPNHPDLIALYTMDSISGATLFDESTNNNDATITGATVVAGEIGDALSFDGINDQVELPFTGGSVGAVSFSLNPTAGEQQLISRGETVLGNLFLTLQTWTTGTLRIITSQGTTTDVIRGSTVMTPGTFYRVVFQSDGAAYELYVGGVEETLALDLGPNTGAWYGDVGVQNIFLGALLRNVDNFGKSIQDHVRFFSRPLTPSEIVTLAAET